jgi:hypothetical protein
VYVDAPRVARYVKSPRGPYTHRPALVLVNRAGDVEWSGLAATTEDANRRAVAELLRRAERP